MSWRWAAAWAALAVLLAGTLAATIGLAANAVPKSWWWAHDSVLLWCLAGGLLILACGVAIIQVLTSSKAELATAKFDSISQPISIGSAGSDHKMLTPQEDNGVIENIRAGGNLPPSNPVFTGRTALLGKIKQFIEDGTVPVVALCGLGGVGKSQIALQYAYQALKAGEYQFVWWVRADSPVTIAEDLIRLAPLVGVTAAGQTREGELATAAMDALGAQSDWLMVFDNAERPQSVAGVLPGGKGHVLITTRYRGWSGIAQQLEVTEFGRTDSVEFLQRRTGRLERQDAFKLAEALGDLPLALAQAAAFIENNDMTIGHYLDLYQDPSMSRRLRAIGLDSGEYPRSVAATWLLHFERLKKEQPAAADLLSLCAFLDPDEIDLAVLHIDTAEVGSRLKRAMTDPLEQARTVGALIQTNLVTKLGDRHLRVHRLVQAVTRDQLNRWQTSLWVRRAVVTVTAAFPEKPQQPPSWRVCASLAPHARTAIAHAAKHRGLNRRSATLRARLSSYLDATAQGLSRFLDPRRQVVRFSGRAAELAELTKWCTDDSASPVMLITGAGGVGKTRLAIELSSQMSERGWHCFFVSGGNEVGAIDALHKPANDRVLLVVDYAEARVHLGNMLSELAVISTRSVRLLLLARSTGEWWDSLRARASETVNALLWHVLPMRLGPAINSSPRVSSLIADAVQDFAQVFGVPAPDSLAVEIPDGAATHLSMLSLHMAALDVVAGATSEPGQSVALRVDFKQVLNVILHHEQSYWLSTARASGLLDGFSGIDARKISQIVAAGILLGAESAAEARSLIGRIPGLVPSERIAYWLRQLYPPPRDSADWLGSLQPDRLAELHVVNELVSSPELSHACLTDLDERQARQAVIVLARAGTEYPTAQTLFAQVMPAVTLLLADPDTPLEGLISLSDAIPFPMATFDQARVLTKGIDGMLPGDTEIAKRASWSIVAGLRLLVLGRFVDAFFPMQEAVTAYRELASIRPDLYRSDLVCSLVKFATILSALGRRDEAEDAMAEAEQLR